VPIADYFAKSAARARVATPALIAELPPRTLPREALFGQPVNEFIFDARWLNASAKLGDRTTYALVESLCDRLIAEMSQLTGVAGEVRAGLLHRTSADSLL
jgi:hypothetical protein